MSATAFVDQQLEVVRRPRAKLPRRPSLLSRLRPQEGWLTLLLVTLAYLAVAWSVAAAGWLREMPSLIPVGLVAILGGLLFAKLPAIWPLPYLVGLVAGVVVSVVQMLFIVTGDGAVERYETFIAAMVNWWEIVTDGGISRDPIPFILSMMLVAWLIAFTASWCTFRWRNAWAALFPLGIGLMTNLSYLPGRLEGFFFLFIAAGILLAVQLHRVEQKRVWRDDESLEFSSGDGSFIFNAAVWGLALILLTWIIPPGRPAQQLNDVWVAVVQPWERFEEEFERLFGSLVPTRPSQLHDFGDRFAFRGGIDYRESGLAARADELNNRVVMLVESEQSRYWRGRVYSAYESSGWRTSASIGYASGWQPSGVPATQYEFREQLQHTVEVATPTGVMFVPGEPLITSIQATVDVPEPRPFVLSLRPSSRNSALSAELRDIAQSLGDRFLGTSRLISPDEVVSQLPPDLTLVDIERSGNEIRSVTVRRRQPNPPHIIGIRAGSQMGRGTRYTVTSTISVAPLDRLQEATANYPAWVTDSYIGLPDSLPERVRDLAARITEAESNAYDKAKAIESYLRGIPFSLQIPPPPSGSDAVDYFLFELGAGYSDYHASAMTIMLRAVGIPTRLATGYVSGQFDEERGVYIILERQGHAWPEVFFPRFGWVEFEPTPALPIIQRSLSDEFISRILGDGSGAEFDLFLDDLLLDEGLFPLDSAAGDLDSSIAAPAWVTPLLIGVLTIVAIGLLVRVLWIRSFAGLSLPQGTYLRVIRFAWLSGLGRPQTSETAREYSTRLANTIPDQSDSLTRIADSYTTSEYGRQEVGEIERSAIESAWRQLRQRLLLRIFQRRQPGDRRR